MPDCGDEQDAKEQRITNQLNAFSQGIQTLQESLNTLSLTQERSLTALQKRQDALKHKIEEMTRNDPQNAHTFNESLGQHYNSMNVLIRSHLDMHQHPQGKLRDSLEKLEHKIDAVLGNDSELFRHLIDIFSKHHDRIDETVRTNLERLSTSYQQSHTILHQDHERLKEKINGIRSEGREKLKTKVDMLIQNDQEIVRTLTKQFDNHYSRFDAAFQQHFDNFSARHPPTEAPIHAGYTKLNEKVDGILRDDQAKIKEKIDAYLRNDYAKLAQKMDAVLREDQKITQTVTNGFADHRNQISSLTQSYSAHEEALHREYTVITEELINFEALIRDFCVQMQVTRPGNKAAKALRRKRADQICGRRPKPYMPRNKKK